MHSRVVTFLINKLEFYFFKSDTLVTFSALLSELDPKLLCTEFQIWLTRFEILYAETSIMVNNAINESSI